MTSVTLWIIAIIVYGLAVWAGPLLWIGEEIFHFGSVRDGETVQNVFILRNNGDELLTILGVTHSCGCTTYVLPKRDLQPGEETKLAITFNTTGYSTVLQPVKQVVTLHTNDAARVHQVVVEGYVYPAEPNVSTVGDDRDGQESVLGATETASPQLPPVSYALKPTIVNLQVDLVSDEDAEAVLPLLDLFEARGVYTTVYVTGQFAIAHFRLVKEIHDRGHQIGVFGWAAGEDLTTLSYAEVYDRLENAFFAVRGAVGELRSEYIADFKPQGYVVTEALLSVLRDLGVRSCTGVFPKGPDHPHKLTQYGLVAIPLAEGVPEGEFTTRGNGRLLTCIYNKGSRLNNSLQIFAQGMILTGSFTSP